MKIYYDDKYYSWQKKAGEYAASQDLWKFSPFIKTSDSVLDFGCGGGYILERLHCKRKSGIEINNVAAKEAKQRGIAIFPLIKSIPANLRFDVIISHHALEHVENPAEILKQLRKYLKPKGISVHIVPIDDWRTQKKYTEKDINKHLYTWTPLLIGNLFTQCGYTVNKVEIIQHHWLPLSRFYYKYIPKPIYYTLSSIWSAVMLNRQIRIVTTAE